MLPYSDGKEASIFQDQWRVEGVERLGISLGVGVDFKVNYLFKPNSPEWDPGIILDVLGEDFVEPILKIRTLPEPRPDLLVWKPNRDGEFSVKSALKCIQGVRDSHPMTVWCYGGLKFTRERNCSSGISVMRVF